MVRPAAIRPVTADQMYLKWLLFGDPGVGKSPLAASAAELMPTLILKSRSDNLESVKMLGLTPDVWELESWSDMDEAEEYLTYSEHGYGFISFDTVTLFQELGLENIMQDLIDQGKSHRKLYLPDKGEYGQNMNRLAMWVRNIKRLPFHFCVVSHAFAWREDDQDEERRWPLIQGKGMPAKISGYMNLVTYMVARTNDDGNYVRTIYTRKEEEYYAKDGWDAFPNGLVNNPSVDKILRAIEARKAKAGIETPRKAVATKKLAAKKTAAVTKKTVPAKVAVAKKTTTARKA